MTTASLFSLPLEVLKNKVLYREHRSKLPRVCVCVVGGGVAGALILVECWEFAHDCAREGVLDL